MHLENVRRADDARYWSYIADEIETQVRVKRGVHSVCRVDQEKGITIRGRANYHLCADVARCTWAIFDYKRLPQTFRQRLTYQTSHDVAYSPRWEANHNSNGSRWIRLSSGNRHCS